MILIINFSFLIIFIFFFIFFIFIFIVIFFYVWSEHKKIEDLLFFYVIQTCQYIEDKDLFESVDELSDEENEMVMLGLTSLLGTRYLEQRNYNVAKSKDWYHNILPKYDDNRFKIVMRMDSVNFQYLVSILNTHPTLP